MTILLLFLLGALAFVGLALIINRALEDDTSACHENCDQGRMCTCRKQP